MKTKFIILFFLFAFKSISHAQKVTVKDDIVSVDGTPVFSLVSVKYPDGYTLHNLNNEKLAVFNSQFYTDSKQITPGNPQGRIGYFDIYVLKSRYGQM